MKYEILTSLSKELRRRGMAAYSLANICPLIAGYLKLGRFEKGHEEAKPRA